MGFRQAVTVCFQDYFTFAGRARRPEFWWFVLFCAICVLPLSIIDVVIFGEAVLLGLGGLFTLLTFVPQLTVAWRRMHDTGRPGWFNLLPAILAGSLLISERFFKGLLDPAQAAVLFIMSYVVAIIVLILLAFPTQADPNRYGPEPAD